MRASLSVRSRVAVGERVMLVVERSRPAPGARAAEALPWRVRAARCWEAEKVVAVAVARVTEREGVGGAGWPEPGGGGGRGGRGGAVAVVRATRVAGARVAVVGRVLGGVTRPMV